MSLSQRLADDFSGSVRSRGYSYFHDGRVRIRHGSASEVDARVRGSQNYDVNLVWEDGVLSAWCECPYFDSTGGCKHIWATILAADVNGYLTEAAAAEDLVLNPEGQDFELSPDEDFEDEPAPARAPAPKQPRWQQQIAAVAGIAEPAARAWPSKREIVYVIDPAASALKGRVVVELMSRDRKADGSRSRPTLLTLTSAQIDQLPDPEDREIVMALVGGVQYSPWSPGIPNIQLARAYLIAPPLDLRLIPRIVRTGRCCLKLEQGGPLPVTWDEGGPWQFKLELHPSQKRKWAVTGVLHRGDERMDLSTASLLTRGLVFSRDHVSPLAENTSFPWIVHLRRGGAIEAPEKDRHELLAALLGSPDLPPLDVPEEMRFEETAVAPRPGLKFRDYGGGRLRAELSFDYGGRIASASDASGGFYDAAERRFIRRDSAFERASIALIEDLGLKFQPYNMPPGWELVSSKLPRVVGALVQEGWHIEAEGKIFRRAGAFTMQVSSGVDWFELHGGIDYGETAAKLPALLEALRKGESMVRLDDGTYGVLPEDWLRRIGLLTGLGTAENGHLRFRRSQAGLLDALLAAQPETRCDETFTRIREELRSFEGIQAAVQPVGFAGHLRDYQREGLGWMEFLRRFSLGGCLADDMGVGKTAQVLALLETRRELRAAGEPLGPSLVVVPRSLIFNWKAEAARFTPQLRILDHTGLTRAGNDFTGCDVILTTYGTLRRDALRLKDVEFDYIVLDEAQAIKNAGTESAKAVRLLRGGHRLALSGTPVENHLGELWSLFEFLNPGMLGAASVFKLASGAARNPSEETRQLLAHALRPMILRRTKEQVARELPPKTEQTVYCEMEPAQRKLYDELREHYRASLLRRIETEGLAKSKIQVLEALLRLRQAACHPGLIDKKRAGDASAKLDVLIAQLREVVAEGHKALVFSQFTSLLAIVRDRLERDGINYEYLDGATRDREARVQRFQSPAGGAPVFLISLKAGGLGLNLTAAEYVFLLDPWWNPAVEAQAVDRAHRIGQARHVFAYRLIVRETVEEKVLELQKTKRNLADAIIGENNSVIATLRREDLELLLS